MFATIIVIFSFSTTKVKSKSKSKKPNSEKESSPSVSSEKSAKTKLSTSTTSVESKETSKEDTNKKKKPRIEPHVETEEAYAHKLEIRIKMPEELKSILLNDWHNIIHSKKLFNLPAKISVDVILDEYVAQKKLVKNSNTSKESAIIEFTNGIKEYFNVLLGSQLLYRFERPQYQQLLTETSGDKPMSSIYGMVHLLRLFGEYFNHSTLSPLTYQLYLKVKLGGILIYTGLDEKGVQVLLTHIHDFLK